jgi:biotin operon repressor
MRTTKHDLMAIMSQHCGADKGVSASEISYMLHIPERRVRHLVTECRENGIAICGHPATGYYVARSTEELESTIDFLKERALHSLKLASKLSKIPLADLVGQLHLKT